MNWAQVCEDKNLQDLPYKIELNRQGQIVMSPTSFRHSYYQTKIALLLKELMPHGEVVAECGVETAEGTKVADTTWSSQARFQRNKDEFSCVVAPEICVEVISPTNTWEELMGKRTLYLRQGALEYWICDELGALRFFDAGTELPQSKICPQFPSSVGESS